VKWACSGWTLEPDGEGSAQSAAGDSSTTASFTLAGPAVLAWEWEPVEEEDERRDLTDADVPVGLDGEGSSPMSIASNADGDIVLTVSVGNAVKGYWYALVTDTELDGDFETVLGYGYADDDGELDPFNYVVVDPSEEKRFFKVRILEDDPDL
jgi:hypothetical protein